MELYLLFVVECWLDRIRVLGKVWCTADGRESCCCSGVAAGVEGNKVVGFTSVDGCGDRVQVELADL